MATITFRDVAYRAHHVQAAHAPGGDQDDDEREHHPHAEGEEDVLGAGGEDYLEVIAASGETSAQEADHHPAYPDAGDAADGAGHESVERALEGEGSDEGPALHPDGAGYTQLMLAL
jgi:hypothetical protein